MQNSKILIVTLLLLAVVSFFVLQNKGENLENIQEQYLIAELQEMVNDVNSIIITKNAQTITLNKQGEIWKLHESDNYIADTNKIATLLFELRNLKLKQKKTSHAENYSKLGLAEKSTIIQLKNSKGWFADISLGKAAQRSQGIYVRKNDAKQTWLATGGAVNVKHENKDWIVTTILDIDTSQIKAVSYTSANLATFTLNKVTPADTHFILKDIPINMQVKADIDINSYANGLQKFTIETAVKKTILSDELKTMTVKYQLFSGMNYQLNLYKKDDKHLMTIDLENAESESSFVQQLENWQFVIPQFKYDALHKSLADLIEKTPVTTSVEKQD